MKNVKVVLVVAVVVLLGVGATFLLTSTSGLKGDFYSPSRRVQDITRDPMSRQYSSQITDDLNSKVNSRANQKMDYKAFEIKYDANGFDDKIADDHLMKRGEFLHAIVTVLNPPDIDSYTTKCDSTFAPTDLANHWTKRDFCYALIKVIAPAFFDFIPKVDVNNPSAGTYEPNGIITRKDAANLVAQAFMGAKVNNVIYWVSLSNFGKGTIAYCAVPKYPDAVTTKYKDVKPDLSAGDTIVIGGDAKPNYLFYTTTALLKKGIFPQPSQVPNGQTFPSCHIDSFGPNMSLYAFHAKSWLEEAKKNIEKKYWTK